MSEPAKQIGYLAAALKAPRIGEAAIRLAGHARDAGWTHEDYLIAVLDREVAARNASGAQLRIRAAGFPARKTLEEFNFDHQPGIRRDDITPLAAGHYLAEARNVVLLAHQAPGNPRCDRPRRRRLPYRTAGLVRHRHRLGRPSPRRPPTRPACRRAHQTTPLRADHHR